MSKKEMNSFDRVMTSIGHKEPDRVPLCLLLSLYGAKELGMTVKEYFSKSKNVVNAQLKMAEKYNNDCIYTFFYAGIEIEAMGGEVIFMEEGPPNAGSPLITSPKDIENMIVPNVKESKELRNVFEATEALKYKVKNKVPIIGVVMSPFSLPVMQMGFEKYLELMYFNKDSFNLLMKKNIEFCTQWANAQLDAGADAICYFDPLASPNMIEKETYMSTGYNIAKETIGKINGPTATHLASGISLPVIDNIIDTNTQVLGFSSSDNLEKIKNASKDRICLIGNLNGIEMVNWDKEEVEKNIKDLIYTTGKGGGLLISDNHGEIPWQVPEDVLFEISEAVQKYGQYPLKENLQDE